MNTPRRILTKNFLAVGSGYFERHVRPSLVRTQQMRMAQPQTYRIAGKTVRVVAYGEAPARVLTLALAHLSVDDAGEPDLIIHAWDSACPETDIVAPWDDPDGDVRVDQYDKDFFGVYVGGEETLSFYDPASSTGYFWTYDASVLPDWAVGAPLRTILHWFFDAHGIQLIHGAVVGAGGRSALITARSGAGKSTTSLACLCAGMEYLGDDYVAVDSAINGVMAHSLYHTVKLTRGSLAYFPEVAEHVWNKGFAGTEKAVLFAQDMFPESVRTSAALDAVLIPRITGGPTRIVPAGKMEALIAMAPTSLLQLPLAEANKLAALKAILGSVPCFTLELGPDVRAVPDVIRAFLAGRAVPGSSVLY